MVNYRNSFGSRLVDLREHRNLKQKDVAADLQLSSQAYSQYEHDRRCPDLYMALRLAKYFDVTLEYLLTGERSGEPHPSILVSEDLYALPPQALDELMEFYHYLQYKYSDYHK